MNEYPYLPPFRLSSPPCSCIVVIDEEGTTASVSIYHLSEAALSRLTEKDTLILLEPPVMWVHSLPPVPSSPSSSASKTGASGEDPSSNARSPLYKALTVQRPDDLLLNGKFVKSDGVEIRIIASD